MVKITKKKPTIKTKKLTTEEQAEKELEKYWEEVEERSKDIIANLIESNLPISATPKNFDLEHDTTYRILLRDDLPNYYSDQDKEDWPEAEQAAEELAVWYFSGVIKNLLADLSNYAGYDPSYFTNHEDHEENY